MSLVGNTGAVSHRRMRSLPLLLRRIPDKLAKRVLSKCFMSQMDMISTKITLKGAFVSVPWEVFNMKVLIEHGNMLEAAGPGYTKARFQCRSVYEFREENTMYIVIYIYIERERYMFMCIYIYIYIYVYILIDIDTCVYIYIYIYIYIIRYKYEMRYRYMCIYIYIYIYMCPRLPEVAWGITGTPKRLWGEAGDMCVCTVSYYIII